jgi:hypothetical protein
MVKIKHLQQIHEDLKSYRNACRVVKQLGPYINETFYEREKVFYLNKAGRELIASEKEENKKGFIAHTLLRNEVYIYFSCPYDWQNEYALEKREKAQGAFQIFSEGLNLINKKKVIADASFKRNGYLHLIEVDNERKMIDNKKKIETYKEVLPAYKAETPILYFFTKTENRKRKLEEWCKGMNVKVMTFEEIR